MAEVLLVEPFMGGSHQAWAEGLVAHSRHHIRLATHPDRFWRWRLRGAAVTLAAQIRELLADGWRPEVMVVSDMVDVAGLLGHLRRELGQVPVVVYFHENQLLYPDGPSRRTDQAPAWINWTSMLAADQVVFNSEFHRSAWFDALPGLLASAPDQDHTGFADRVRSCARVIPVGVDTAVLIDATRAEAARTATSGGGPIRVIWNQRWDHDKDPAGVLSALIRWTERGADLAIGLAGERHSDPAADFGWAFDALGGRLVDLGHLGRPEYRRALLSSDVMLSMATHEFFGISIVEAAAAGVVPVLPDRLSHPELMGEWAEHTLYGEGDLDTHLDRIAADLRTQRSSLHGLRSSMRRFDWAQVIDRYDHLIDEVR